MNLDEFRQSIQYHNAGTCWNSNNADNCSRHFQGMVIYGDILLVVSFKEYINFNINR